MLESKELVFGLLKEVPGDNVIIMGLDNFDQMVHNLKVFNKTDIDKKIYNKWWKALPDFPEKLLNPSLWT